MPTDHTLNPGGEFLLYTTDDGQPRVECRFENETIWLSQALIGELYDRSKKTISEHLKNLFEEGELVSDSVVRKFQTTASQLNVIASSKMKFTKDSGCSNKEHTAEDTLSTPNKIHKTTVQFVKK